MQVRAVGVLTALLDRPLVEGTGLAYIAQPVIDQADVVVAFGELTPEQDLCLLLCFILHVAPILFDCLCEVMQCLVEVRAAVRVCLQV